VDQLGPIAVVGAIVGILYFASGKGAAATQTAFEGYFRGFQPDPWPHGVQEQDIERHWGGPPQQTTRQLGDGPRGLSSAGLDLEPEVAEVSSPDPRVLRLAPVRGFRVRSHN